MAGLNNSCIQHRLLAETTLTFAKAQEIAQAMELAEKDVQSIQAVTQIPVHKVATPPVPNKHHSTQPATQPTTQPPSGGQTSCQCYYCGGKHAATSRHFKTAQCHSCGKTGHISRVCRSKGANSVMDKPMNVVVGQSVQPFPGNGEYTLFPVVSCQPMFLLWKTSIVINGQEVQMEIDTDASVKLVSEATFTTLKAFTTLPPLEPASIKLHTYTGEEINTLGTVLVTVEKKDQKLTLPLLVVVGTGPNLIGQNWLAELHLDWREVNTICECYSLNPILERNQEVFQPRLGLVKDVKAKLYVDTDARPLFFKARSVPYALRQKVEQELERLQDQDVSIPVPHSEWAAPLYL